MIPKNSISIKGTIDACWLFTFRVEPAKVQHLLPKPLELVTFGGYAYFNLVVSHLSRMRPAILPFPWGIRYQHVAYRLYAKYQRMEGLYFLRSDADNLLVATMGNLMTDFQFNVAQILIDPPDLAVSTVGGELRITLLDKPAVLPEGSPFPSLREAANSLKYKPAGISVSPGEVNMLMIDRDESKWMYQLRSFEIERCQFLEQFDPVPEICYEMRPIEYRWNRATKFPIPQ